MQKHQNTSVFSGYSLSKLVNMPINVGISKMEKFESMAVIYIDSIYSFALYMTENEYDAQDLVQRTYIRAYKRFDDFKNETNYKTWLLKILVNTFIKSIPYDNVPVNISHDSNYEEFMNFISDEKAFEEELFEEDLEDDFVKVIQSLPIERRMVFILADIEKLPYKEISYIIDCPIETVAFNLHKGRQMLKEKLQIYSDQYGYKEGQNSEKEVACCEQ